MTDAVMEACVTVMEACVTDFARQAAKRVTGGNATWVDDDIKILEILAYRAVTAGLLDDLDDALKVRFAAACASHPIRKMAEASQ